jgi:crotonobetainyl-CoA:carnitine CoA-transferase CaiB-like acyl-CoA transferase
MRSLFGTLAGIGEERCPPFDLDNRGKRSVVLDLRTDEGRESVQQLVATADVFLTNLRPDALERLGLGHEELLAAHPRLVYAAVTGYGLTGPDRDRAGYDVGAWWARSGLAHMLAVGDEPPPMLRGGMGDHVTGMTAAAGILAALFERHTSGRGRLVDVSLLRTGMYTVGWDLGIQLAFGKLAPTAGREGAINPLMNSYRSADGRWFWLIGLEADRHWPTLVAAIGRPDLATDERFADARARRHNRHELVALLDETFAGASREEWGERFDEHGVWWAAVNTPAEVVEDPQALAAGAIVDVAGMDGNSYRAVATPVRFGDADVGPSGPVPRLGEHTEEVLRELKGR